MTARYEEIADDLRRRIRTGEFPEGSRLPSETELREQYAFGLPTLRRAVELLQNEGLIRKVHGRGTFVLTRLPTLTYQQPRASAAAPDGHVDLTTMASEVVVTTLHLAELLKLPTGTTVLEYVISAREKGIPRSLSRVYLPGVAATSLTESTSPWGDDLLAEVVRATGADFACTEVRTAARRATEAEATALRLPPRAPVLWIERRSTTTSGGVIEAALLLLPGDSAEALFHFPAQRAGS